MGKKPEGRKSVTADRSARVFVFVEECVEVVVEI